ncbi:Wadjet anti-phage system protein JetD domain-containing protein [Pseudomonas sp. 273]|uniref:Wadjet anti-phage system protein JetD domain-containing protein n=1 Tax=Pseudomonas sp. 273 TaxID=75692 RepID=UPI0023D877DF|nr:Wadjet anti-phage system protein JetD domain-containing protein [Pseudomonas sp. 273]
MESIAKELLAKLLEQGNKSAAGVRQTAPVLTRTKLKPYQGLRNWHQRQACEEVFLAARDAGAIRFFRDKLDPSEGTIERIELLDTQILASFLGRATYASALEKAKHHLEPLLQPYDVIAEVISRWSRMLKVRGIGPLDTAVWLDAARAIEAAARTIGQDPVPVREFSARVFQDSKRLEKLTGPLDILLMGSLESAPRLAAEVWQEMGLFKEEQPVLLAGYVHVDRGRVSALLDAPFIGLPASAILGVSGAVESVITIENLTTFHSEAKRSTEKPVLVIYTAGMPSPAWRAAYERLLSSIPTSVPVYHWGDVDEGGYRIASVLAESASRVGHRLQPHCMSPEDVPAKMRKPASERTLLRMKHFAEAAGWHSLVTSIAEAGFTVEQEALAS